MQQHPKCDIGYAEESHWLAWAARPECFDVWLAMLGRYSIAILWLVAWRG